MSTIEISDRAGKTIKEFLLPELQKNFWRLSNHPMLRALGMERNESPNKKSGSPMTPRVKVPQQAIGRRFEVEHLHTMFGGGVHAAAENTTLRSGQFESNRSFADAKFIQGSFEITRQAIAATRDKKFALAKEIQQNAMGATHSVLWNLNRMLVGNTEGILCYVDDAVSASTSFQVQTNTSETNETPATQHLNAGDQLLIGTQAEIRAGTAESVTVSSVTGDITFTATANETVADEDLVCRADVYDTSGSVYTEVTGLVDLVTNTGTVQNINKANNAWFQSHLSSSVATLTLNDLDAQINKCRRYAADPSALFMICNEVQWRRIASLYTHTRNFDVDAWSGNLVGGVSGLTHYAPDGKVPILIDDMVSDGVIYIVDPNGFYWGEMAPFSFSEDALSMDGTPGQRKQGTLNYEFAFFIFGNLAQTNAKGSAALTGITAPSV